MHILIGGHVLGLFATHELISGSWTDRGHMFLAYSLDESLDGNDLIIRGGPAENNWLGNYTGNAFGPIEMQINVQYEDSFEDPDAWAFGHPDPQSLLEPVISLAYSGETGSGFSLAAAWQSLSYLAQQIGTIGLDYDLLNQNSNSVVGTLLSAIGFGPQQAGFVVPGGDPNYYPAVGYTLTGDWLFGGNISYILRGGYAADYQDVELPYADRLFALNGNSFFQASSEGDFVTTFGGNDELHDGNRKDTLEGGTGDDTYILQDDGAADIVITGEGDDIVRGGGAEDRLVLRIDILDQMYEDWRAQLEYSNQNYGTNFALTGDALLKPSERMGDEAATSGVPILGGFWDMACDGIACAPLNTGSFYPAVSNPGETGAGSLASTFPYLVYSYSWIDSDGIGHEAQAVPFGYSFELVDGDLVITFAYGTPPGGQAGLDLSEHTVTIEDFQDGDFGIHIAVPSVIVVPGHDIIVDNDGIDEVIGTTEPWAYPSIGDAAHIDYINNHASFITIPASLDPASTGSIPSTPPVSDYGMAGTGGDDDMSGTGGDDLIRSQAGNDSVSALSGDDRVDGGDGDDIIWLGAGADLAIGGIGLDQLYGEGGDDGLAGGDGNDSLNGGTGNDLIFGDDGNDMLAGDLGDDLLYGGEGNDSLDGGGGDDRLDGGSGDDSLSGGSGLDQLAGGDGADTLSGGEGADMLSGDGGSDALDGDGGDDSLSGGLGDDQLRGGTGNDQLAGDAGNDGLWGSTGDDRLDGGEGNDMLFGEGDNDSLFGGAGDDSLSGSSGLDILDGGAGNDTLTGGAAADRFAFASGYGRDVITDFAGNDFIVLDHALATSFAGVMAHAAQVGNDVVFTFGDDSLVLANKALSALNAGDFEFA